MLTLFFRSIILFVIVVVMMRTMGKREIGQLQPFEMVIALMIADFAASPLENVSIPLIVGLIPIMALVLCSNIFSIMIFKSQKLRRLISGKPVILVRNGRIDEKELIKNALTISDLLEQIRLAGYPDIAQVGCAVYETSGQLSVFPISQTRPVTAGEMGIKTGYETVPLTLIVDGAIQKGNLIHGVLSEDLIRDTLRRLKLEEKDILLMSLTVAGVLQIQLRKSDAPLIFCPAKHFEGVKW